MSSPGINAYPRPYTELTLEAPPIDDGKDQGDGPTCASLTFPVLDSTNKTIEATFLVDRTTGKKYNALARPSASATDDSSLAMRNLRTLQSKVLTAYYKFWDDPQNARAIADSVNGHGQAVVITVEDDDSADGSAGEGELEEARGRRA